VLHTAGHGSRFTLNVAGSGLTERSREEVLHLQHVLRDAMDLLVDWQGELQNDD